MSYERKAGAIYFHNSMKLLDDHFLCQLVCFQKGSMVVVGADLAPQGPWRGTEPSSWCRASNRGKVPRPQCWATGWGL